MRNFIKGFIVGVIIASVATAYAAQSVTWRNGSDVEVGTDSNPVYVQGV